MKSYNFDYIIVGSGLAGLATALHASEHGNVAILTKSSAEISNSHNAQGGIACVYDIEDKPENHISDTLVAGRGLCEEDSVEILVKEGVDRVKEVIQMGMKFDTDEHGNIILGLEGGHSQRRILHAGGDATGAKLTEFMLQEVKKLSNVTIFESLCAIEILHKENQAQGIMAWDLQTKETKLFYGGCTVLASGGISKIYTRSTNPETATGDGVSLAIDAGVKVRDLEFIQFHPSALALEGLPSFLISEAVRGEGAYLLNNKGERFMLAKHPNAELAPRDVVASSIFQEMKKSGQPYVHLSIKHLDAEHMKKRFQSINRFLLNAGLDFTKEDIPVAPAAHYMVGGITTDLDGRTSMSHLYAIGEVASTGVMGANRLASNSLLECLVFAKRAVDHSVSNCGEVVSIESDRNENILPEANTETLDQYLDIRKSISEIMMNYVGILRSKDGLNSADMLLQKELEKIKEPQSVQGQELARMIKTCRIIVRMAQKREESRGGHIRIDFPELNSKYESHSEY